MKIGFDGKRAIQNLTGLGNYSRYIIETLAKYFPENHYILFAPKHQSNSRLHDIQQSACVSFRFPQKRLSQIFSSLWRLVGVSNDIRQNNIDIYHGLSGEIPLKINRTHTRTIVTIHDLIFLRYPQYYNPIDRLIYRWKSKYACLHADKIIAISECTKRDIVEFFHISPEKIDVIYQGCHPIFQNKVPAERQKKVRNLYKLPHTFILNVGTIEPRKNLMLAVKSLLHLPEEIHLVAVGKKTTYLSEIEHFIEQHRIHHRVHILQNVPLENLVALYSLATVFVYPSLFEGFGIPIIEALWQGIPTIAATGSCLEEAGGKHSMYIHPEDDKELAEKILQIYRHPHIAREMSEKGLVYVQKFNDSLIARQLITTYSKLI